MKFSMNKKAQQEMVGFVLIVVIVMVALIVFLVMSLGRKTDIPESNSVNNILGAVLGTTTSCSLSFEGNNKTFHELISENYSNPLRRCYDSEEFIGEALNLSLVEIIDSVSSVESAISYYEFKIYFVDDEDDYMEEKYKYVYGNCSGSVYSSMPILIFSSSSTKTYHTANLVICIDE